MTRYRQLDEQWLSQNLPGDKSFVVELLQLFVCQCHEALQVLNAALVASQLTGVREQAHRIKGSASALGLRAVTQSMAAIEDEIRAGGDFAAVQALLKAGLASLQDALSDANDYMKNND